jgi:hypothetical protein
MAIQYDGNQNPWLEPRHVNLLELAGDIEERGLSGILQKFPLSSAEWAECAQELAVQYKKNASLTAHHDIIAASVNRALAGHALYFPPCGTAGELHEVNKLMSLPSPDMAAVQRIIFALVMNPRIRACQLAELFLKLAPFDEFAYLIDAATLSFYRGNFPAAFMTIIPVVEGLLLRWQGYPVPIGEKPSFATTLAFVRDLAARQPAPLLPLFYDSWIVAADTILRDHLSRHFENEPSRNHFNRHLAFPRLEDQHFETQQNVTRVFLLVDLLSEIFLCEKRINDPRRERDATAESPHCLAYVSALRSQACPDNPEKILLRTHPRCQ